MSYNENEVFGIIPVTKKIRDYLKSNQSVEPDVSYGLFDLEYSYSRSEMVVQKIMDLKWQALQQNKSLVWVYQELVLSGYGYDISHESDIYQVAKLAYEDMVVYLRKNVDEALVYEECCVLEGNIYEKLFMKKQENLKKMLSK